LTSYGPQVFGQLLESLGFTISLSGMRLAQTDLESWGFVMNKPLFMRLTVWRVPQVDSV
jgi:hypothetical protein